MAGLNDAIRSSTQGGSIAKPLMLALGALLATNVLFGGKGQTASASAWRIGRAGEQAAAGRAWRRGQFLGRFRTKSAGFAWSTWFGPWPRCHQDTVSDDGRLRG